MIFPNTFRYTIVIPAVDSYVLQFAPKGWEEKTEIAYKRSEVYFGQTKNVTVPLEFTRDGYEILLREYIQYNAQANAYIRIEKVNPTTQDYELAYYGKLDFSSDALSVTDDTFTLPAIDAGIEAKIKAFENTKFEFPVDVPEAIDLTLTPLTLIEKADFIFTPSELDQQPGYTGIEIVTNEIKSVNQSVKDVPYRTDTTPDFSTDGDWFYTAQVANTVKVSLIDVKGSIQSFFTGSNRFKLQLVKNDGTPVATFYDRTISNFAENFLINGTVDVPLLQGERLFLYQVIEGTLGSDTGFNWEEGQITASYSTQSPETKCKAFRPKYLFSQLLKKINGGFDVPVQSFLLDQWEQLTITSGDAIRQIEGAKVKTSFADFFKSISAVTCAGHSVENKVTLETRQSYFRNAKTISMLDSTEVSLKTATNLLFNKIKTGYPNKTYDEINGKDEINSTQEYVIDSVGTDKELDIRSVYRADAYGIEFLRINLEGKSTTDNDSDNDVFFVYANATPEIDGSYKPFTNGTVTGVSAGNTFYNWYISPKRNLRRWGSFIRSVYYNNSGYQIRFTESEKNANVTTVVSGESVTENSNIFMSELDQPYFIPMYAEFDTNLPNDLWQYFNNAVYGYGEFMFKGYVFNGFFMEAEVELALNSPRRFKLLLTTDNKNLLNLIQ